MKRLFVLFALFLVLLSASLFAQSETEVKLMKLKEMKDKNLISSSEYDETKKKILDRFSGSKEMTPLSSGKDSIAALSVMGQGGNDDRATVANKCFEKIKVKFEKLGNKFELLSFTDVKNKIEKDIGWVDPGKNYDDPFFEKAKKAIGARYYFWMMINNLDLGRDPNPFAFQKFLFRFNVDCQVFDSKENKIVYTKKLRNTNIGEGPHRRIKNKEHLFAYFASGWDDFIKSLE